VAITGSDCIREWPFVVGWSEVAWPAVFFWLDPEASERCEASKFCHVGNKFAIQCGMPSPRSFSKRTV
jgi:hypothetical protein